MIDEDTLRCRVFIKAGLDPWAEDRWETPFREPSPQEKLAQAEPVECEVLDG